MTQFSCKSRIDACCSEINPHPITDREEIFKFDFEYHLNLNFVDYLQNKHLKPNLQSFQTVNRLHCHHF